MRAIGRAALLSLGVILASCSTSPPPTPGGAAVSPKSTAPSQGALANHGNRAPHAALQSSATTLDAYKREVAELLLAANSDYVYRDRPPELLYGIVVLQFAVNSDGTASKISLLRVPSHAPELGPRAVQAVQRASPFMRPSASVTHGQQSVTLTESLLYRDDGKFIARTLALPQ